MLELHRLFANALVLYFLLVGLWGLFLALRRSPVDPAYRATLYISLALGVVQALIGLTLVLTGLRPRDDLHYLYGLSVIVTLPLVQQYLTRRRVSQPLVYGLACLFMCGLAIRGITTGG